MPTIPTTPAVPASAGRLLTVAQYAALTQIHPTTIRRLAAAGKLPGAVKVGHQWRLPAPAADAETSPRR